MKNYSYFLKWNYFIEIIMDSHVGIRNNRDPMVYFVQFLSMVTVCKTIVQCHSQDFNIDTKQGLT